MNTIRCVIILFLLQSCFPDPTKAQSDAEMMSAMSWQELSEKWQALAIAGKNEASLPYARAAFEKARRDSTESSLDFGNSLDNLGYSLHHTRHYAEAETCFMAAVEHARLHLGIGHEDYITRLSNLAMLHLDMGELAKAVSELSTAVNLADKHLDPDNPYIGVLLNNLGLVDELLGDFEHALSCYFRALELTAQSVGTEHVRYATRLLNIAAVLRKTGKNDEALRLTLRGLAIYEKQYGKNHPFYIAGLHGVILSHMSLFHYEEALALSDSLLVLSEKNDYRYKPQNYDFAQSISTLYYRTGQYDRCLKLSVENLEKCTQLFPNFYARNGGLACLSMLALEKMGRTGEAAKYALTSYQFAIADLRKTFRQFSEQEQLKLYATSRQWTHNTFLLFALRHPEFPELTAASYEYQMTVKGLSLFNHQQLLASLQEMPSAGLEQQFNEWSGLSDEISRLHAMSPAKRTTALDSLCMRANELERNLALGSNAFHMANQTTHWEEVQSALLPGEAAIEFSCVHTLNSNLQSGTDSILYEALLIKSGDTRPRRIRLFEENALNKLHATKHLYDPAEWTDKGNLGALIWQPLSGLLSGINTIYYAPAGLLYQVNLDAVPVSDVEIMADRFRMHRLVSTRQLVEKKITPDAFSPDNALVFGGIRYDVDSSSFSPGTRHGNISTEKKSDTHPAPGRSAAFGEDWPFLNGSLKEVKGVRARLESSGVKVYFADGLDASESSFKNAVTKAPPALLHLATHGFFIAAPDSTAFSGFESSADPMARAGLVLAGANRVWSGLDLPDTLQDGILTALEISHLNLKKTQLAVLSACGTGQGKVEAGEGILGLQRAFKMAGVHYIILNLWNVQDHQAQEFVDMFYEEWLMQHNSIPDAFRQAQKRMRSHYSKPFQPMAWAGFMLLE